MKIKNLSSSGLTEVVLKLNLISFALTFLLSSSSSEGQPVDDNSDLSSFINEWFTSVLNCSSSVTSIVTECASNAAKTSQEALTEKECESSIEVVMSCLKNSFADCGVDPSLREAYYTKSFKEKTDALCSEFAVSSAFLIWTIVAIAATLGLCALACCGCRFKL